MSQWSKKAKNCKDKLLERQNKIRDKYGLRPLRRVQPETILYLLNDSTTVHTLDKEFEGGMYQ